MTLDHRLTHPLHTLTQFIGFVQHHFQKWVRTQIIDDAPQTVEIWQDEEFLMAEYKNILYVSNCAECDLDQLVDEISSDFQLEIEPVL